MRKYLCERRKWKIEDEEDATKVINISYIYNTIIDLFYNCLYIYYQTILFLNCPYCREENTRNLNTYCVSSRSEVFLDSMVYFYVFTLNTDTDTWRLNFNLCPPFCYLNPA